MRSNPEVTTWILLRGLTRETRHWGDFPKRLSQALNGAAVIALDLPGNGSMNAYASPMSIDATTEFCRAELKRRGAAPPYRVLAISLGGMVAADWATRHASEIDAAVLINTSMRPFSAFHHRLRPGARPRLLQLIVPGMSSDSREAMVFALTSRLDRTPAGLIDIWVAIRRSRPVSAANAIRQLVAAARFHAWPVAPSVDVLVLSSAGDRLVDTRCSQELARHWACAIAIHPSAGHDLPLDDGDWVVEQVSKWIERR